MRRTPKSALTAAMLMALTACIGQEPGPEEGSTGNVDEEEVASQPTVAEPAESANPEVIAEAETPPTELGSDVVLQAGSTLRVVLDESVSTDSHTAGQTFGAHIGTDVNGPNGVAVPRGTRVRGVVRASRESISSDDPATLILAIESLSVDGEEIPLEGSVSDTELEGDRRDSTGQTVGKIAIGTAAGAILGGILGDGDRGDAVRGAIAGAAGGAIVAFTTQDGHASVDEGAVLVVTLESPIVS